MVYHKTLPAPSLPRANHQINPCLVSAREKYANKVLIRERGAKKLHCAQQRGKSESGLGCDGACCCCGAADEGAEFVVERRKIKQSSSRHAGETCLEAQAIWVTWIKCSSTISTGGTGHMWVCPTHTHTPDKDTGHQKEHKAAKNPKH